MGVIHFNVSDFSRPCSQTLSIELCICTGTMCCSNPLRLPLSNLEGAPCCPVVTGSRPCSQTLSEEQRVCAFTMRCGSFSKDVRSTATNSYNQTFASYQK